MMPHDLSWVTMGEIDRKEEIINGFHHAEDCECYLCNYALTHMEEDKEGEN